jgi:hypothetical protein
METPSQGNRAKIGDRATLSIPHFQVSKDEHLPFPKADLSVLIYPNTYFSLDFNADRSRLSLAADSSALVNYSL